MSTTIHVTKAPQTALVWELHELLRAAREIEEIDERPIDTGFRFYLKDRKLLGIDPRLNSLKILLEEYEYRSEGAELLTPTGNTEPTAWMLQIIYTRGSGIEMEQIIPLFSEAAYFRMQE